jgi:hypothetical protein
MDVRTGINDVQLGIMAVRSRLATGRLRVLAGACPKLLFEASLYRYEEAAGRRTELPVGENDHALDALRYLVSRLDERRLARGRRPAPPAGAASPPPPRAGGHWWKRWGNEDLWTPLG